MEKANPFFVILPGRRLRRRRGVPCHDWKRLAHPSFPWT